MTIIGILEIKRGIFLYLKEFDLDLPYVVDEEKIKAVMENECCEYYVATKLDYKSNWHEKRHTLRLETRCITAMLERLFGKMKNDDGCQKILVECVDKITDDRILNQLGVFTVQVKFNYIEFQAKSEKEEKIEALHLLMKGIEKVVAAKDWDIEPFRKVFLLIKQADYLNEWIWKKAKRSPNKSYSAEVLCQHTLKSMDISLVINAKSGEEIIRKMVISEIPDEFAYARHLGEIKWLSDEEAALINKDGTEMVTVVLK